MDHFSFRVKERYGIEINKSHKRAINNSIMLKGGGYKVLFWKKITNRITLWLININNIWIPCYYDKSRNTVVTCVSKSIEEINSILDIYMGKEKDNV
jgi:hypothetical protein